MRRIIQISVIVVLTQFMLAGCKENKTTKASKTINQIESWKQIILDKNIKPKVYYHLYSGEQYENDKWVTEKPDSNEDYFIGENVSYWSDSKIGSFFDLQSSSPSGDWTIYSKNYYGTNTKLNYVLWSMNTTQAEPEAVTIERKYTFDKSGVLKQKSESIFKMGTRNLIEKPNFMEHPVKYWTAIDSLPFRNLIKK